VNSALRYRAQAPFVETLLHEIGMSTQSMNLEGLQSLSKADYSGASSRQTAEGKRQLKDDLRPA
jgi:hypothetical protein